jgi:hypothetical protein
MLLAKNDIFGQFERLIMAEFYEALRLGLSIYGDWDRNPTTLELALDRVLPEIVPNERISAHMRDILRIATDLVDKTTLAKPVSLDEVAKMKLLCDFYFTRCAKREVQGRHTQQEAPRST